MRCWMRWRQSRRCWLGPRELTGRRPLMRRRARQAAAEAEAARRAAEVAAAVRANNVQVGGAEAPQTPRCETLAPGMEGGCRARTAETLRSDTVHRAVLPRRHPLLLGHRATAAGPTPPARSSPPSAGAAHPHLRAAVAAQEGAAAAHLQALARLDRFCPLADGRKGDSVRGSAQRDASVTRP